MIGRQTKSRKVLAVVLPASLLWTMVACALLCSIRCDAESQDHQDPSSGFAILVTEVEDCCPIKALPSVEITNRRKISNAIDDAASISTLGSVVKTAVVVVDTNIGRSSIDQPLAQLPTLRI